MNEIVSKPWWEFVGVITGVILGVIAIIIAVKQTKKKSLAYSVIYSSKLLKIASEVKDDLKVTYKGNEVKNLSIFEIKFFNNGRNEIRKEDFESSLELTFDNIDTIFSLEIGECKPANLSLKYDKLDKKIIIEPLLLNSKDSFSIKTLLDGNDIKFNISARVAGVKSIVEVDSNYKTFRTIATILSLILVFFLVTFFAKLFSDEKFNMSLSFFSYIVFIFFLLALIKNTLKLKTVFSSR